MDVRLNINQIKMDVHLTQIISFPAWDEQWEGKTMNTK